MNSRRNKLENIKEILSISSGDIIGGAIVSFFWLYLASVIDVDEYGKISYFMGIAGLGYIIALIGTRNTITVYSAKNFSAYSTLAALSIIFGIISTITVFFLVNKFDSSLLLSMYVINEISLGYIIGKRLFKIYSIYVLIQKSLTVVFGLVFYYIIGPDGIILGISLSYVHFGIIFYKILKTNKISKSQLDGKYGFIMNNYFINIIGGVKSNLDKIIIAPLFGLTIMGNYALILQFYALLALVPMTVSKIFLPQDAQGIPNDKSKYLIFVIAVVISITSFTISPYLIPIFFKNFIHATDGIRILSLGVIPSVTSMLLSSRLLGLEKSKYVIIGYLFFVIPLILGIILSRNYGIIGITMSYVAGLSLSAIYYAIVTKSLKIK